MYASAWKKESSSHCQVKDNSMPWEAGNLSAAFFLSDGEVNEAEAEHSAEWSLTQTGWENIKSVEEDLCSPAQ